MIVVEGPDGAGKTTLAKKLCQRYSLEYRRPPEELLSSTTGPSPGLVEWWRDELRASSEHRASGVYDRAFAVSEPIYSSMSLREPMCDHEIMWRMISDLWAENPWMIFCMTDPVAMQENTYMAGRPQLRDLDTPKMVAVNFLYWASYGMWLNSSPRVVQYDYNRDHESYLWSALDGQVK